MLFTNAEHTFLKAQSLFEVEITLCFRQGCVEKTARSHGQCDKYFEYSKSKQTSKI